MRVRTARLRDEDDVEVLGENLVQNELGQDHISEMHETLKYDKTPKVRDDFRCRLNRIAKYWLKETPGYAEQGVRLVTEEEKNNKSLFFRKQDKYDLVYVGMNYQFVLKFLKTQEIKKTRSTVVKLT